MNFVDRIGGRSVEQPPARTLFGRWLVNPSDGLGSIYLNGCPVSNGDVLVPGATETWTFVQPDDTLPIRGNFLADALPGKQDVEALFAAWQVAAEPGQGVGRLAGVERHQPSRAGTKQSC